MRWSWPRPTGAPAPSPPPVPDARSAAALRDARVLLVHPSLDRAAALATAPVAAAVLAAGARAPLGVAVSSAGRDALAAIDLPLVKLRVDAAEAVPKRPPKGWDVVVDLTAPGPESARAWADAVPASTRLGFAAARRGPRGLEVPWSAAADVHAAEHLMAPLAPLGLRRPRFDLDLAVSAPARTRAAARWADADRRLLVWLGPWAAEQPGPFLRAGFEIAEVDPEARIVVGGPPSSKAAAKAMARSLGARAVATTPKAFSAAAALFAEADLVVADDDDPLQLALLSGRPALALFVHKDPLRWGPPRTDARQRILQPRPDAGRDLAYARLVGHHAVELWGTACAR